MRMVLGSMMVAAMLCGVSGCGGVTESEKKAADKVPELEIDESTTSDKGEEEPKKTTEAEPAKP